MGEGLQQCSISSKVDTGMPGSCFLSNSLEGTYVIYLFVCIKVTNQGRHFKEHKVH